MSDYVALLDEARRRVYSSPLYRRFIEHTPLENDIAVWMADFASEQTQPPAVPDAGLVDRLVSETHELLNILEAREQIDRGFNGMGSLQRRRVAAALRALSGETENWR
jgi:hypothetical protein